MTQSPPDMKVRLSSNLRRQVEEAARANNRTLNSEIVFRLEQSFMPVGLPASAHKVALDAIQASPVIRLEKRLLATEARLEARIEAIEAGLQDLKERME